MSSQSSWNHRKNNTYKIYSRFWRLHTYEIYSKFYTGNGNLLHNFKNTDPSKVSDKIKTQRNMYICVCVCTKDITRKYAFSRIISNEYPCMFIFAQLLQLEKKRDKQKKNSLSEILGSLKSARVLPLTSG